MRILFMVTALFLAAPVFAQTDPATFRLAAPDGMSQDGFLDYLLPRFSLKTGIRIRRVDPGESADLAITEEKSGRPAFYRGQVAYHVERSGGPAAALTGRFEEWLASQVGRDTIAAFAVDGQHPYSAAAPASAETATAMFEGDHVEGERLAMLHCGRCHVVSQASRMNAIGSTPSFGLLRGFPDWFQRFQVFYTLNPHPAFTQIADITEPFHAMRPPPIVPLELTQAELDAILAFVTTMQPADLGAPIRHQ